MALIGLIGDVMLGRRVDQAVPSVWGDLLPILQSTDFNLANLECAVTGSKEAANKRFVFKAGEKAIESLLAANIRVVNLANNHILDFGDQGLYDTIDALDAAGIAHVGAGKNLQEASCPYFLECKGVTIGISGFTDNEPGWAAGLHKPGTAYLDPALPFESLFLEADVNILSIHWGPNMQIAPSPVFRSFARSAAQAGVQLLHGHSAHIFQGLEQIGTMTACYDAGDFVDDYAVDPLLRNDQSFFFAAEVDRNGLNTLHLLPVLISDSQVNVAKGKEKEAILAKMERLSKPFGTRFEQSRGVFPLTLRCRA